MLRDVKGLHERLHITNEQYDLFKGHMHTVLTDMDKPAEMVAEVLGLLEQARGHIVH